MASIQSVILDLSAVSASFRFPLFVYLIMRPHTVQYAIPGSAILRMCRPTLSFFPSSSPTSSDGHNSQFHAFFQKMFSLDGSPRSTTTCLEAMLDVKPHNALRKPFPEAGKCFLDSSLRYSCAKTRRRSETDLKYFFGFRFFFSGIFFFFLSGNTVGEKRKSAERRNNYRLWIFRLHSEMNSGETRQWKVYRAFVWEWLQVQCSFGNGLTGMCIYSASFRTTFTWTSNVEKSCCHAREFSGFRQKWVKVSHGSEQFTELLFESGYKFSVPVDLFVGLLTSQQHASVPHGRICSDSLTCCHTEKEVAHPAFHLTPSQYTDTGPTSPRADPITPGGVATGVPVFKSLVGLDPGKISAQAGFEPGIFCFRAAFNLHHLGG